MKLLIVSATSFELDPLQRFLEEQYLQVGNYRYRKGKLEIHLLITGVGQALTAFSMGKVLAQTPYDLCINMGIAGAFNRKLEIGQVVQVSSERFADLGVEEADGSFTDIHSMNLIPPNQAPFQDSQLLNNEIQGSGFLPLAKGISVNKVHGYPASIDKVVEKFNPDIESMEGAAFFYACLVENVPFMEIRSISNYVEARNRDNWNIPLAIDQLNEVIQAMVQSFESLTTETGGRGIGFR
ncbi:MAG: futalosine hydrolase [Saprospiraceae bacterium]|nr:MAG: futalosine hydrolase [Saprospiraceae bacterium]